GARMLSTRASSQVKRCRWVSHAEDPQLRRRIGSTRCPADLPILRAARWMILGLEPAAALAKSSVDRVSIMDDVHIIGVKLATEADARRDELDRMRRIPADLFKRAGDAGLFRQLICKELGGLGRSPAEWFCTGVEMARWEPSLAWVVTQGAGDMATYVAAGDPAFTSALLADQRAYIASSDNTVGALAPEDDGFRFGGRWGFCSGCHGATWVGGRGLFP